MSYRDLRARTIAALAIASALLAPKAASTADAPDQLHLASGAEAEAALGIGSTITAREDGRRTPLGLSHFEWWYFDALLADGTTLVGWFGDNWPFGSGTRVVYLQITPPDKEPMHVRRVTSEPGRFSTERADVAIGPHRFSGDLDTYTIFVDPTETGGLGCNLVLKRTAPPYRPGTGHVYLGPSFFAWLVPVPGGDVSGTIIVGGKSQNVTGSGYHDHNWGNARPRLLFDRWWWGRARVGDKTLVVFELDGKGGDTGNIQGLFLAGRNRHLIDEHGASVAAADGPPTRHPDPRYVRPVASSVTMSTTDGAAAEFRVAGRALESVGPRSGQPPPWYSRFESSVTLTLPGQPRETGSGVLEYMELK